MSQMETVVIRPSRKVRWCFDGLGVLWVGATIADMVIGSGPIPGLVVAAAAGIALVIGVNRVAVVASDDRLVSRGAIRARISRREDISDFVATWSMPLGGSVAVVASDGSSTALNVTTRLAATTVRRPAPACRRSLSRARQTARWPGGPAAWSR